MSSQNASSNTFSHPLTFTPDAKIDFDQSIATTNANHDSNQSTTMGIPMALETWMQGPDEILFIDFQRLAHIDEEWRNVYQRGRPDFKDPNVALVLTTSTLRRLFKLEIQLPADRLCPTIPSRYQYVQFIQRLVDTTNSRYTDCREQDRAAFGVDIGIGASCIYPLLACRSRPEWKFTGTECDEGNVHAAQHNIGLNGLTNSISIVPTSASIPPLIPVPTVAPLLTTPEGWPRYYTFTMSNPPFYTSRTEMDRLQSAKPTSARGTNTGADVEVICDGGEVGFITRHFSQSTVLRGAVQWYTTLVGRASTLEVLLEMIKEEGISNWVVVPLQPGGPTGTRRWVVAWSYDDLRPAVSVLGREAAAVGAWYGGGQLSLPTEVRFPAPAHTSAPALFATIDAALEVLELKWTAVEGECSGVVETWGNVWDRRARRRRARGEEVLDENAVGRMALGVVPVMVARVTVVGAGGRFMADGERAGEVVVRWMKGQGVERGVFESFAGWLGNVIKR